MNFPAEELKTLETAGYFHDIGKIAIPSKILNKNGKFTEEEYDQVKRHSEAGYQILKSVEEYSSMAEYVLCHHERWDGKGYPRKLKGTEIPLISRIISVADSFEAMTGQRLYKDALDKQEAISELKKNSGTQFDAEIVEIFINKALSVNDL